MTHFTHIAHFMLAVMGIGFGFLLLCGMAALIGKLNCDPGELE